ncbi:nuclear valosin-containing protein-like isoform X1 [Zootermopsis nevadensis]|uniref:nuclear valosin-containing protein-like isoform X1 n=1 Tax=Zootermopsis nevadensis TaxID=136037 RepID=UPI000B8E49DE|nr:nuclear valosin-containing protein-like isoform X1 [Zootermopsis nevadensis]
MLFSANDTRERPGRSSSTLSPPFKKHPPLLSEVIKLKLALQYMEEHNYSGTDVNVDEMVDELRELYAEYARRKRGPFKQGVRNAFNLVYQTWGMTSDVSDWGVTSDMSDISSASDRDGDLDEMEYNRPNDQMIAVYMRQSGHQNKRKRSGSDEGEKELINISSDDDMSKNEYGDSSVQKSQNGAVTADKANIPGLVPPKNNVQPKTVPMHPCVPTSSAVAAPKKKKKWKDVEARKPSVTFRDFGGSSKVIQEVCKLLIHVRHPEVYKQIGVTPPRGFLLHGPPGCGKTLLAHAISGELGVPLMNVAGPELVAGVSGESEERIRDLFDQAAENAPCILFLDEVDALAPNRHTAQREMERRIVAQLLSCLDDLGRKEGGDHVVVIGATNRPDSLDPALRRAGRFDREVCLGIPDKDARVHILQILCNKLKLAPDFNYEYVAVNTPGFVGADLMALTREASMVAVNRVFANLKKGTSRSADKVQNVKDVVEIVGEDPLQNVENNANEESSSKESSNEVSSDMEPSNNGSSNKEPSNEVSSNKKTSKNEPELSAESVVNNESFSNEILDLTAWLHGEQCPLSDEQLNELHVDLEDFKQALKCVQPSAKREGFATVPDVTWDDVGSLRDIREELQMTILAPVRHPEQFAELGISAASGVLLCGPPGCGKTLLAKAVANEAGINFISVKGPELLNMYVGESEKAVRQCFQRARNSAPCVIFFDELDALCPKRSESGEGGASMRVVNQMLTEMDGIESRKGVFLMAASNRPEIVDPAVLRPGRLDKILYVGLPSAPDRVDILNALTKNGTKPVLDTDVDLKALGESPYCSGYTGADLAALVREAEALKEVITASNTTTKLVVSNKHFSKALEKIRPSVSDKDQKHYEKLQKLYSSL